jgi:hypothetical protein
MTNLKLLGKRVRNLHLYQEAQEIGFEYLLNPNTSELHLVGLDKFGGSHNFEYADLSKFIGLTNIGITQIHVFPDGTQLPVYDLDNGEFIGIYALNKCIHCFPK